MDDSRFHYNSSWQADRTTATLNQVARQVSNLERDLYDLTAATRKLSIMIGKHLEHCDLCRTIEALRE